MADPGYIVDGVLTDGEAWVGIATTTLGSDTATVTFTSTDDGQVGDFSQYMDLVLVSYVRLAVSAQLQSLVVRFNNDSGSSQYPTQRLVGNGSVVSAASQTTWSFLTLGEVPAANAGANMFGAVVSNLFDINSGKYKSVVSSVASDTDSTYGSAQLWAGTWKSQAAIVEIDLYNQYADIAAGSTFSLFGVLPRMVA